jgi:hypothetical protein
VKTETVTITPEQAEDYLLRTNTHNRNLKSRAVDAISRDILSGNWQLTGETIKFDKNGVLLDGQHRLTAIVRAGVPVQTAVARGLEPEAQRVIDTGMRRSVAQQLTMDGTKYANNLAAMATIAVRWEQHNIVLAGTRYQVTASEQYDWIANHPEATDYQMPSIRLRKILGGGSNSALAWSMWHTSENVDRAYASSFWESVDTGANMAYGDPRLALRDAILRRNADRRTSGLSGQGLGQELIIFLIARSWNAWREGKELKVIKIGQRDKQPEFV